MIRKAAIVARTFAKPFEDDQAPVLSRSGAVENSPGLESGVGVPLQNFLSPGGATHPFYVAPPGLNDKKGIRYPRAERPGLLSVVPPGLGSAGLMTLLPIDV
jgi:hypothetical protein